MKSGSNQPRYKRNLNGKCLGGRSSARAGADEKSENQADTP
jgi:hypothetical protein